MNQHTIREELLEAVFSVWSAPNVYSKDQRGKLIESCELQVSSGSSWLYVKDVCC
jgi:hypothetical protein